MYRVMIVEDEPIIRTGIKNMINRFQNGFQVEFECPNAYIAWEQFQAYHPDVIITDIVMKGMTGLALATKIRENGNNVPIVILSGYSEFEYARIAIQQQVFEYVLKPLSMKKFAEVLTRIKVFLDDESRVPEKDKEMDICSNSIIQRVDEYIKNNIGGDLSLITVAEKVNLSSNYLSILFKNETNRKYSLYILHIRMEKAKELLRHSDLKIYEIASVCGYNNVKHFICTFKKYANMTPMQYKTKGSL